MCLQRVEKRKWTYVMDGIEMEESWEMVSSFLVEYKLIPMKGEAMRLSYFVMYVYCPI